MSGKHKVLIGPTVFVDEVSGFSSSAEEVMTVEGVTFYRDYDDSWQPIRDKYLRCAGCGEFVVVEEVNIGVWCSRCVPDIETFRPPRRNYEKECRVAVPPSLAKSAGRIKRTYGNLLAEEFRWDPEEWDRFFSTDPAFYGTVRCQMGETLNGNEALEWLFNVESSMNMASALLLTLIWEYNVEDKAGPEKAAKVLADTNRTVNAQPLQELFEANASYAYIYDAFVREGGKLHPSGLEVGPATRFLCLMGLGYEKSGMPVARRPLMMNDKIAGAFRPLAEKAGFPLKPLDTGAGYEEHVILTSTWARAMKMRPDTLATFFFKKRRAG